MAALPSPIAEPSLADRLNADCFCIEIDRERLWDEVDRRCDGVVPRAAMANLVSNVPVFVSRSDHEAMIAIVRAIEAAVTKRAYRDRVLSWAPDIARHDPGPIGVFTGYDFHLTPEGPRLIEVNTNAGGAFLCASATAAQTACCAELENAATATGAAFEARVIAMFESEWRRQGRTTALRTIAITDDDPIGQALYWEFRLAEAMFERHGYEAVIADPRRLVHRHGRLWVDDLAIDLVYDRLVDFALDAPEHRALRDAHLAGDVVLTPSPRAHALYADKRNLAVLSDPEAMAGFGLATEDLAALHGVPVTVPVTAANAEALWRERGAYYFKPAGGHAGKAVYRGDKTTRGVWERIVAEGHHVAQRLVVPSRRNVLVDAIPTERKADIRLYTHAGEVLLTAARLYRGQTTNFHTVGGGLAPVVVLPECL